MFNNRHFDRVRELFSDQFEPEGDDLLYRKGMKAAPIRVTRAERDGFVADFNRRIRYAMWGLMPAVIVMILALALLGPDPDSAGSDYFLWGGLAVVIAPFLLAIYWAWNAPARALDRRPMLGIERTRGEVREAMLKRTSYGQLAFGFVAAALVLASVEWSDLRSGWSMLWLALAGALVLGTLFQMFRKWNRERR